MYVCMYVTMILPLHFSVPIYTAVIRKKEVTAILKFWRYWYQNFQLTELYVMSYVILQESVSQMISKGSNWHFEELLVILSLFNLEKRSNCCSYFLFTY